MSPVADEPAPLTTPEASGSARGGALARTLAYGERFGLLFLIALLILIWSIALPDSFPATATLTAVLSSQPVALLAAFAVLIPLVVGEFDLSVGYGLGFSSVLFAYLVNHGVTFGPAVALVILAAMLVGVVNGTLVVRIGVNSFIATLGVGTILSGFILMITNGAILSEGFPQTLLDATRHKAFGIILPVYYVVGIGLLLWFVLEHTPLGRWMYATGAGEEPARLTGIRTDRLRFWSFVAGAALWSLAGIINTGQIGAAYPTIGPEFLLPAFAAVFLGATAIRPRYFNVWGAVAASLMVTIGVTGFEQAGVKDWIEPIFNGVVLLIAVIISTRSSVLRQRIRD